MSSLAGLFVGSSDVALAEMQYAIMTDPLMELDQAYDFLGNLVMEDDHILGESFHSQLALARRFRNSDGRKAATAKLSLRHLISGFREKWKGVLKRERFECFASAADSVERARKVLQRGSYWRLADVVPEASERSEREGEAPIALLLEGATRAPIIDTPQVRLATVPPTMAFAQHIGDRTEQQDKVLTFEGILPDERKIVISIVADGHHSLGGIASATAVQSFVERFFGELLFHSRQAVLQAIFSAVQFADKKVQEKTSFGIWGGTTFVAYIHVGIEKYIVNIGDSRAYFLSDSGEYTQVSIDHSSWADDGRGRYGPIRRLAVRMPVEKGGAALGDPDIFIPTQEISGHVFLFSDGVEGLLGKYALGPEQKNSLQQAVDLIIKAMLTEKKLDNLSASVIRVSS